jgi:hypothetical protein
MFWGDSANSGKREGEGLIATDPRVEGGLQGRRGSKQPSTQPSGRPRPAPGRPIGRLEGILGRSYGGNGLRGYGGEITEKGRVGGDGEWEVVLPPLS